MKQSQNYPHNNSMVGGGNRKHRGSYLSHHHNNINSQNHSNGNGSTITHASNSFSLPHTAAPPPLYYQTIVQPGKKYQCFNCSKDVSSFTMVYVQIGPQAYVVPSGQPNTSVPSNSNISITIINGITKGSPAMNINNIPNTSISNVYYYCIPCFGRMKRWPSNYQVINKLQFPVFQTEDNWTALQEIYLFQGLEKHGFGNWNQISQYIETNKTKQDVQKHYTQIYLNSPNFLPQQSKVMARRALSNNHSNNQNNRGKQKQLKPRQTLTSKRIQLINYANNLKNTKNHKQGNKPSKQPVEIVGYMPLRNDYQFQYDNEAELLLAQMQFNDQDTPEERQLKFKMIQLYNKRLTQRNRKKQFILSRGILDLQKQIQWEKSMTKGQKQIYNMMKIFSRFNTVSDHDELIKGIIRQKQLRQKIQQYKQLRRRGFKTKSQIEQEIQRKNQTKTKKKGSGQYNFGSLTSQRHNNRRNHQSESSALLKRPHPYFSKDQIQLLRTLKLSSISYMMIKQTILREYAKLGTIDRQSAYSMFSLEKFIINSILDHLQTNRQISCSN